MFSLIKQVFIVLLSFSESLAHDLTKYLFLNDGPCMVRSTLIDLFPVELEYFSFMISLVFSEAKTVTKYDCKCKFNSETSNSNKKYGTIKTCQCECKNYRTCKKEYSWNPSTCICENSKYLKSIDDTSVILRMWWSYSCSGYCINKKDKYSSNKCYEYCFNKMS